MKQKFKNDPLFQALSGDCGFMAANMYAKSIFGEDVLANLSIEKPAHLPQNASVQGHIRIRAKSQVCQLYEIEKNRFTCIHICIAISMSTCIFTIKKPMLQSTETWA